MLDQPATDEREHFERYPGVRQLVDLRNFGQVLDHAARPPHPSEDRPQ